MAQSKPNRKRYTQCILLKDNQGKLTNKVKTIVHTIVHKKN